MQIINRNRILPNLLAPTRYALRCAPRGMRTALLAALLLLALLPVALPVAVVVPGAAHAGGGASFSSPLAPLG